MQARFGLKLRSQTAEGVLGPSGRPANCDIVIDGNDYQIDNIGFPDCHAVVLQLKMPWTKVPTQRITVLNYGSSEFKQWWSGEVGEGEEEV